MHSVVLLGCIRFLDHFKPSEPHLVPYLVDVKRFSADEILHDIFPIVVYSTLFFMACISPAVRKFGYKNCIIFSAAARLLTRMLLLYGTTLLAMQVVEGAFGVVMAAEVLLDSYVFVLASPSRFLEQSAKMSMLTRLGYVCAAELSELLLFVGVSLTTLFYISLVTVGCAAVLTFFLPDHALTTGAEHDTATHSDTFVLVNNSDLGCGSALSNGSASLALAAAAPTSATPSLHPTLLSHIGATSRRSGDVSTFYVQLGLARKSTSSSESKPGRSSSHDALCSPSQGPPSALHSLQLSDQAQAEPKRGGARNSAELPGLDASKPRSETLAHLPAAGSAHDGAGEGAHDGACASPGSVRSGFGAAADPECVAGDALPSALDVRSYWRTISFQLRHPELAALAFWWVTMYGPVMSFVDSYCTNLFEEIDSSEEYNGHVTAAAYSCMALAAFATPRLRAGGWLRGRWFHSIWTALVGVGVLALALTRSLLVAYLLFCGVMAMLQMQMCLVQADSAGLLESRDYSTMFGVNAMLSLVLQSVVQVVLQASKTTSSQQYLVAGFWSMCVACVLGSKQFWDARKHW